MSRNDDWVPLLVDNILLVDLQTSGHEIVGRLWTFIESIKDENDKQTAIDSFIYALKDSFNENHERVCNPGKVQRLFIGVLQGRLQGVQIDDSIEIPLNKKDDKGKEELVEEFIPIGRAWISLITLPKIKELSRLNN